MTKNPTLYLVDGSSYLYRAFHALPNLTNSHGEPTGALLGVANMLKRLLSEADPEYIAVVFDAKGPTFRHELYPEYKANRPPMPAELRQQVESILEFTRMLGLPLLQEDGVEADDVIGTLARSAEEAGMDCVISTGDKDMAQLVSERTTLTNTMTNTDMDRAGVKEKFDVSPEQIVDFLALTGDKSDNIPGVEKCGPKTAAKWLGKWGSLDEVIAHADEVGGKIGEYLRAALDQLPLSRELATIRRDLEIEQKPRELLRADVEKSPLISALKRFEFNSWLQEFDRADDEPPAETDYRTVWTDGELDDLVSALESAELIAFDTETTSLDPMQAELVGLSFCTEGRTGSVPAGRARLSGRPGSTRSGPRAGPLEAIAGRPGPAESRAAYQVRHERAVALRR
jgi:DNA polymerase-1